MLPTTLTAADPESERRRYKIVRLDTHETLPGLIMSASVDTGICVMQITRAGHATEKKEYNFGGRGLRIVCRL